MPIKDATRTAALIIAGGRGTRFWPESRAGRPKPLFSIDGKTSLLADTIARMQPLVAPGRIFVLVSADQAADFRRAVRTLIPPRNLIVEPEGRGVITKRISDETIVAVMPADHFVAPPAGFRRTIAAAAGLARSNSVIVVVGVTPTRPETGYGYQEIGLAVGRGFKVARFVEKPRAAIAGKMVQSGRFLWNAGMFVMRIATLAAEFERHAPALAAATRTFAQMKQDELQRNYSRLVFDSFDRTVVEKSVNVLGVRARFRWHDVGSWEGLWEALRGSEKNLLYGNAVAIDTEGVLARAGKRLMVLLGVSDLVAVDTGDAILIARRSQSQDVRRVVEELQRRGLTRYL
jgi:mannose-1-phosphate guanylyltransferase